MYLAVRENTPISALAEGLTRIHLVRPVSYKKMAEILSRCPQIDRISSSPSVQRRLSPKTRELLKEKRIHLEQHHNAGRAVGIGLDKIRKVADLRKDFLSLRKISKETGIPKSTIHYLIKKAKRKKIKRGKHIFYTD
jgi:hypothetical protein